MKKLIYLDNSATTPVDPRVLKAMLPYFTNKFGNASSLYQAGLDNRVVIDRSQAKIAQFLGCAKEEVYFTSGATESDNMAILGVSGALNGAQPVHIVVSQIEHDAILEPSHQLESSGVKVTYLPVNKKGLVELSQLKKAIRPNTVLVSIMYVNNEVGTIQPIAQIGKFIADLNKSRGFGQSPISSSLSKGGRIYFHTDATQAPSYCNCDINKLGVDLMSLSAHKIYGPKGIGVIYIKKGTPIVPMIYGGHQQDNVRPGTYNVSGIVGLAKAIELIADKKLPVRNASDSVAGGKKKIKNKIPDAIVNGDMKFRVPSNANFIFKGVEGESVVLMLSDKGIAVSTGSA